jgi:hypothetical protein
MGIVLPTGLIYRTKLSFWVTCFLVAGVVTPIVICIMTLRLALTCFGDNCKKIPPSGKLLCEECERKHNKSEYY